MLEHTLRNDDFIQEILTTFYIEYYCAHSESLCYQIGIDEKSWSRRILTISRVKDFFVILLYMEMKGQPNQKSYCCKDSIFHLHFSST